ncbi:MAG TPA: EpsI family protein [Bryobacteraceae bacterium]|nr:EpsI family protein [Bryobacteraceae bacterium]
MKTSTSIWLASGLLVLRAAMLYSSERPEYVPVMTPLSRFPLSVGSWRFYEEGVIDQETRDFLKADDLLNRIYLDDRNRRGANLFVAAFRTLSTGAGPHSPKNCLPGTGWTSLSADELTLDVGAGQSITVNRYVVARDAERSLVLYWYQSRGRVVASEYKAKIWSIADAIRDNRTDTALVRVVVPIHDENWEEATACAVEFVKAFFFPLRSLLPA